MSEPTGPGQDLDSLIAARRKALATPAGGDHLDSLIASRRQALASQEKPGVFARAGRMMTDAASNAFHHPIETLESAVTAPIKSAYTAVFAPGAGESRPDLRLSKGGNSSGRAIDTSPYDAAHGGVTRGERTAAGVQTLVNAASPTAFGGIKSAVGRVAGKAAGKAAALATTGAATGAAYNPQDPGAGAIAGAGVNTAIGGAASGATGTANKVRQVRRIAQNVRNAAPVDEVAVEQGKIDKAQNTENYGVAAAEAAARGGTSPAVQQALDHPVVAPYVEKARARNANASDAEVLADARKRIARDVRGYQKTLKRAYDPDIRDRVDDLGEAARALDAAMGAASEKPAITLDIAPETFEVAPRVTQVERPAMSGPIPEGTAGLARGNGQVAVDATGRSSMVAPRDVQGPAGPAFHLRGQSEKVTPGVSIETPGMRVQTAPAEPVAPLAPSWGNAVSSRARMGTNEEAFTRAAQMTDKIARGTRTAPNKLKTESPAAWLDDIVNGSNGSGLPPEAAERSLDALYGRAKENLPKTKPLPLALLGAAGGSVLPIAHGGVLGAAAGMATSAIGTAAERGAIYNRLAPYVNALERQAGRPGFLPWDIENALQYLAPVTPPKP